MIKHLHSFFSFLLIIFIFIVNLSFFVCGNTLMDYFSGEEITENTEGEFQEQNNCLCDTDPKICDEYCCCDEECPKKAIEDWRDYAKCIDEKDTVLNFADRCIDQNLVFRYNKQRGLRNSTQTEDIIGKDGTINNYCYSMDNARKEISDSTSSTNDTERSNKISKKIDELFFNDNNEYSENEESDGTNGITIKNKKSTRSLDDDNLLFIKSGKFSLFSGVICSNTKNVEFLVPENHTCLKERDDKIKDFLNKRDDIILEVDDKEYTFKEIKSYEYNSNGLLDVSITKDYTNAKCILEVEFVVNLKQTGEGFINIVFTNTDISIKNYYTFKNSIFFTNTEKLPYRYSGNGGYINGFPLKIYYSDISDKDALKIFNEFYIVGREKDGKCRFDNDVNNYLYYYDAPILFNKNFTYSCKKNDQNKILHDTTLFKKIRNIRKVAKYGSSSYKSIDNTPDWINITVNPKSFPDDCNTISMNIFIGTNVTGIYSHKYVYDVDISCKEKGNTENFKLEVLYFDLEANHIYDKEPDIPTFVPRIPDDLLDPLFYSEVDK